MTTVEEKVAAIMGLSLKSSVTFDGVVYACDQHGLIDACLETPEGKAGPIHPHSGQYGGGIDQEVVALTRLVEKCVPAYSVVVDKILYASDALDHLDQVGMVQLALAMLDQAGLNANKVTRVRDIVEQHVFKGDRQPFSEEESWTLDPSDVS
jgi:hypothetical protein